MSVNKPEIVTEKNSAEKSLFTECCKTNSIKMESNKFFMSGIVIGSMILGLWPKAYLITKMGKFMRGMSCLAPGTVGILVDDYYLQKKCEQFMKLSADERKIVIPNLDDSKQFKDIVKIGPITVMKDISQQQKRESKEL